MITSREPSDWKDLQRQVGRILAECGMAVEVEKTVETPRGRVAIDVHAEEDIDGRHSLIVVECKHWAAPIPHAVVHAFRTVVAETGANVGYIVSKRGFQSGAVTAARDTNIRLRTWQELQAEFEPSWLRYHFGPTIRREFDRMNQPDSEPANPPRHPIDTGAERRALLREYGNLWEIASRRLTPWAIENGRLPALPLRESLSGEWKVDGLLPDPILDCVGYRDLLDVGLPYADAGIARWQQLIGRRSEPGDTPTR